MLARPRTAHQTTFDGWAADAGGAVGAEQFVTQSKASYSISAVLDGGDAAAAAAAAPSTPPAATSAAPADPGTPTSLAVAREAGISSAMKVHAASRRNQFTYATTRATPDAFPADDEGGGGGGSGGAAAAADGRRGRQQRFGNERKEAQEIAAEAAAAPVRLDKQLVRRERHAKPAWR